MRALCLTVDLDRDVNLQIPGRSSAGSIDRGQGNGPRFSSAEEGLSLLIDLLDEMGIKATFFAEAATLRSIGNPNLLSGHEVGIHGCEHEDLTSQDEHGIRTILTGSSDAVKDILGNSPKCFRAPYMKVNDEIVKMLPEIGIEIDSSYYTEMSDSLMPYRIGEGLWEMPVPEGRDTANKKISAYLWPMHEGKRGPKDYVGMAKMMKEGAFVLATHTWHIVESRDKGMMSKEETANNIENVRDVLAGIMDMGFDACTLSDAKNRME